MDMRAFRQLQQQVARLESQLRRQAAADPIGEVLRVPGLVGAWTAVLDRSTPLLTDISGNGMHLSFAGDAHIAVDAGLPLLPYFALDGTGDYLSRADEAKLDILGTEARIASALRGLTFAAWVRFTNAASANEVVGGKWDTTGNQRSWLLFRDSSGNLVGNVSSAGAATNAAATGASTLAAGTWYHIGIVFSPSTYVRVYLNGVMDGEDNTSVPSSLFNSSASFALGMSGAGSNLNNGRIALPWLAASAKDDMVKRHFSMTRALAGV